MRNRTAGLIGAGAGIVATLGIAVGGVAIAKGGMERGMHRMCDEDRRTAKIERVMAEARDELALEAGQEPAYRELAAAITEANGIVQSACAEHAAAERPADPVAHLARAESFMATGLEAVRTVRAPFENFYAQLDEGQRATLDEFMHEHRRHHRHHDDD